MNKSIATISISLLCSLFSSLITAHFVSRHWESRWLRSERIEFGHRPADDLVIAATIREGKTDQLLNYLECKAQVAFFQQYQHKNDEWSFIYSHQVLDAYSRRYGLRLVPPLVNLAPPKERFSDLQLAQLTNESPTDDWAVLYKQINRP